MPRNAPFALPVAAGPASRPAAFDSDAQESPDAKAAVLASTSLASTSLASGADAANEDPQRLPAPPEPPAPEEPAAPENMPAEDMVNPDALPGELPPPDLKSALDAPPEEEQSAPSKELFQPIPENADSFWSPDAPPPVASSGVCIYRGAAYFQADAVLMSREGPTKAHVLATDLASPSMPQFRTNPFVGYSGMARLTYGRMLRRDMKNRDHSIEFTFLGFGNWHQQESITSFGGNALVEALDPTRSIPGFNGSHTQSTYYTSGFNSYEINYRVRQRLGRDRIELSRDGSWVRKAAPMFTPSFFGGLRVATLNERFTYTALGTDPTVIHGNYDIHTTNTLIGPQAGVDIMYQHARWRAGARTKAGPYVNTSGQQSQVVMFDSQIPTNPPDRDEAARSRQFSFIYEVNFMAAYQIRRNVAWRIGFDLLAIDELALAPNQIRFPAQATPTVDNSGFILMMGGETGLEVVW